MTSFLIRTSILAAGLLGLCAAPQDVKPPGSAKAGSTKALEAGTRVLQRGAPLKGFDIYLDGFHPMKDAPVEYIISEKLFDTLPAEERRYWHPHNGEILSGQLIAPGIPESAEHALMKKKMNSYGKTWHVWNTGANGKTGWPGPSTATANCCRTWKNSVTRA